jgi:hypothetical protein
MKRRIFPLCGLLSILFFSCDTKSDKAEQQKKDYIIDMTGLDSLKLGMGKAELEAILDTTFKLKHIKVDGGPYDTFHAKYKGVNVMVYLYESDDKTVATLYGIQSGDTSCKTINGIGMGTEKAKVIDAYTNYKKYIAPEYETYPIRSKTKSMIAVMDTVASRALLFHIINRKVSSVEVSSHYEFE